MWSCLTGKIRLLSKIKNPGLLASAIWFWSWKHPIGFKQKNQNCWCLRKNNKMANNFSALDILFFRIEFCFDQQKKQEKNTINNFWNQKFNNRTSVENFIRKILILVNFNHKKGLLVSYKEEIQYWPLLWCACLLVVVSYFCCFFLVFYFSSSISYFSARQKINTVAIT